jgi:hypothetical protein
VEKKSKNSGLIREKKKKVNALEVTLAILSRSQHARSL